MTKCFNSARARPRGCSTRSLCLLSRRSGGAIVDGRIAAAAQEERFTRKKHDESFPAQAIAYCLKTARMTPADLDYIAFYERPLLKFDRLLETYLAFAPRGFAVFLKGMPLWMKDKLFIRRKIRAALPTAKAPVVFPEHHESHSASAFFPSPFEKAAILTLDGVGEWATSTLGVGEGGAIDLGYEMRFPHSLGLLYSAFTYCCGFKVNSGEYKLMGLAPSMRRSPPPSMILHRSTRRRRCSPRRAPGRSRRSSKIAAATRLTPGTKSSAVP